MSSKTKFLSLKAFVIFALLTFLWSSFTFSQHQLDIAGQWEGAINIPGMELGINIEFRSEDDTWEGDIDIPMQGARDLPLANIKVEGTAISFDLPNVPGNPSFKGTISADRETILGDFTQSGQTFTFSLTRKSATEAELKAKRLEESLNKVRAFVDSTMKIWKVPGLAMAVVKEGEVILSEGFGLRNVKDNLPVTSNTLFAIGSCTKSFTTVTMGILVDEGKLDWDEPVRTYLPTFKLKDEFATLRMTPRDLVTHRSGLPRHDLVWYNSSFSRKELFDRLQYLEPSEDFRVKFQYQNLMFMTAGYLVGQVTGGSWEDFVRKRIFGPLGMTNSNFSVLESHKSLDFALPYKKEQDGEVKEIPFRNITTIGPAGSINSNVADMSKWIMLHLNKGKFGETQIISEAGMEQMHTPYMVISQPLKYAERSHSSYGLGWFIETYRGHKRVSHGGGIDGFSALVSLLPQDNTGMVVLTNLNGTPLPTIVSLYATDLLLQLDPIDWNSRIKSQVDKAREAEKKEKGEIERKKGTKPAHQLAEYAGEYEHPGYGVLTVELEDKKLKATFNSLSTPLEHWHYEVFRATGKDWGDRNIMITFLTNAKGDVDRVSVPFEPSVKEVVFTRKPPTEMSDPKFLAQFVGEYEVAGQTIKIELKGENTLIAIVPGQPTYELEPYKGTEFNFKGLRGFSIEFKIDKKKHFTGALVKQPNGVFTATRKK